MVLFSKLAWPSGSSCSPNEEVGPYLNNVVKSLQNLITIFYLALLYASYDCSLWKRCPVLARKFATLSQRYSYVIPIDICFVNAQ